jgi:hypothetical protein
MTTNKKDEKDGATNALPDNVIQFPFGGAASLEPEASTAETDAADEAELQDGRQESIGSHLGQFTRMIDQGLTSVVLNSWVDGVSLPRELTNQARLVLNWSHRFRLPDFEYDEHGISGTLSFDSGAHHVKLPWECVYVMFVQAGGSWAYWPEQTPSELRPFLSQILKGLQLPER